MAMETERQASEKGKKNEWTKGQDGQGEKKGRG
jgi:hypothetical protein